MQVDQLC